MHCVDSMSIVHLSHRQLLLILIHALYCVCIHKPTAKHHNGDSAMEFEHTVTWWHAIHRQCKEYTSWWLSANRMLCVIFIVRTFNDNYECILAANLYHILCLSKENSVEFFLLTSNLTNCTICQTISASHRKSIYFWKNLYGQSRYFWI